MHAADPRDIITPDAFTVAPHLLGLPLARPGRRAAAIAVDLLLVAVLTNAGGLFLGFAAAAIFFRISARSAGGNLLRRSVRRSLRLAGALVLFIACLSLWDRVEDWVRDRDDDAAQRLAVGADSIVIGDLGSAVQLGVGVGALYGADNDEEARTAARQTAERLRALGTSPEGIRKALDGMADELEENKPEQAAAIRAVADSLPTAPAPVVASPDSLAAAYAAAVGSADTAAAAALRPRLARALARDTLAELGEEVEELEARNDALQRRLAEAEEEPGLLSMLGSVADDLGLGFGWTGVYFTAFLALWRGQTPGKRLLGIRVVRLNGASISWWAAFERFGGYAAGLFTGLLGFFPVFTDRNRQAIHDKICETVVVWEGGIARNA